jgi:predicted Rossmann fold flavoprotein
LGVTHFDTIIIGAGAAGLFCGAQAGQRGQSVLVVDHAKKPAEKVRISGGGRCNFTNIHTAPENFLSQNPHFAKSALARYTPFDFMDLLTRHEITWHEKTLGQLFCDGKSGQIIEMLLDELQAGGGQHWLETSVERVAATEAGFALDTMRGALTCDALVIATGGLSIPKMGATGFAYDVARQFGHEIIETRAGLVPFTFSGEALDDFLSIAGTACDVRAASGKGRFDEAMLFTHRGLSGPAMLQISSYWAPGAEIEIDLFNGEDADALFKQMKAERSRQTLPSALEGVLPKRLAALLGRRGDVPDTRLADLSHVALSDAAEHLSKWRLKPTGTEGYRTAEVTLGGVDTDGLSSRTMESRHQPGLYFIGECVDVTGWLGGYNFQWAWASAHAAAEAIAAR